MSNAAGSKCLCSECSGLCCRYFALPIDNPDNAQDFDNIRWYLCHENVTVFVEKKQWYIGIANRCKQLQSDNRCGIYETRPKICRSYSTENCDFHGGDYEFELLFTSAEQLERYATEKLAELVKKRRKQKAGARRRRPDLRALSDRLNRQARPQIAERGQGISLPLLRTSA
jgi:Fe-S-cluster containining protein